MSPNPRQAELVEEVQRLGAVSVEALAERFGVTLQTVRRDVKLLSDAGEIVRDEVGTLQRLVDEFSAFAKLPDVRPEAADLGEFVLTPLGPGRYHLCLEFGGTAIDLPMLGLPVEA